MNKVVITVSDYKKNNAGPKAKLDIENILSRRGFLKLNLNLNVKSKLLKIKYMLFTIPNIFRKSNYTEIIFQYPAYSSVLMNCFVKNIRKYTNAKLFFLVHDIESLRKFKDNSQFIKNELQILNNADGLIVHNQHMKNWLQQKGITTPMVNLQIFDYLNPQPLNDSFAYNQTICFAGNLRKSRFLKKLNWINHKLTVFGPNPLSNYPAAIDYQGQYSPEELPSHLKSNFGLVWDGDSLDTCNGSFGKYMQYNAPHKISLYLSSGIPVVIWEKAAMADFIKNNNVGLVINNLNDLEIQLSRLTDEEYSIIKQNAINVAEKLRVGYYTNKAIDQLEKEITHE